MSSVNEEKPAPKPVYKPLDSDAHEIRVIDVAQGESDSILECTFRIISLEDEQIPPYETISYCWGTSVSTSVIRLDGTLTEISARSEAALKCMRLPDRARTLWIDAVCINQFSNKEKSRQVANMSAVYSNGTQNLVYLGEDDGVMSKRAADAIMCVLEDMLATVGDIENLRETLRMDAHAECLSEDGFRQPVDFEALRNLFSSSWFRRLWVIQEIALAKSSHLFWGKTQMELLYVTRAAIWISYKVKHIPDSIMKVEGLFCAVLMNDFVDMVVGDYTRYQPDLCQLFFLVQGFEKTEPRDGVYAVLGLVDKGMWPEVPPTGIGDEYLRVDYSKPLVEVSRDATRFALCQRADLGALRMVAHQSDDINASSSGGFPTWAIRSDLYLEWHHYTQLPICFDACKGLGGWTALGDLSLGPDIMVLEGFVADYIRDLSGSCDVLMYADNPGLWAWMTEVMAIAHERREQVKTEDIAITLLGCQASSGDWAEPRDVEGFVKALRSLFPGGSARLDTGGSDKDVIETIARGKGFVFCQNRRFFVTADGRPGLGPRCMRLGDIVAVLKGGGMPLVLRQVHDGYQLAGEAYVHGIMDGEAVRDHMEKGGDITRFAVC